MYKVVLTSLFELEEIEGFKTYEEAAQYVANLPIIIAGAGSCYTPCIGSHLIGGCYNEKDDAHRIAAQFDRRLLIHKVDS